MLDYPMKFFTVTTANDKAEPWNTASQHAPLDVDIPKEFGGNDEGYSPEDLMGMAAANCFVATFKVCARLSKISFDENNVLLTN